MESIDFHEYSWNPWNPWTSWNSRIMHIHGIHGYPLLSMALHGVRGYPWNPLISLNPWIPKDPHGIQGYPSFHGYLWSHWYSWNSQDPLIFMASMEIDDSTESMDHIHDSMGSMESMDSMGSGYPWMIPWTSMDSMVMDVSRIEPWYPSYGICLRRRRNRSIHTHIYIYIWPVP